MASLISERKGSKTRYRVQFRDGDNRRRSIRLGPSVNRRSADAIKSKIESLVACRVGGNPLDNPTAKWVQGLGQDLHDKLVLADLIEPRRSTTLAAFVEDYIERNNDLSEGTVTNFRQLKRVLTDHFGSDRSLRSITEADAFDWRASLVSHGYAEATLNKFVKRSKQIFRDAVRRKCCEQNVFLELKGGSEENSERMYFVTRETLDRILAVCGDPHWRLIVLLARIGGLRNPSELLELRWSDITGRMAVSRLLRLRRNGTAKHGDRYHCLPSCGRRSISRLSVRKRVQSMCCRLSSAVAVRIYARIYCGSSSEPAVIHGLAYFRISAAHERLS